MADVTVNTSGFDDAAARFARAMDKTLRAWAFEVERRAKKKSPIDTGFNSNSIYTVTPDGKMASNNQPVSERPGLPKGPSKKNPKRKYVPGVFADQAPIEGAGGYQDVLNAFGGSKTTGVQLLGGSMKAGPTATVPAPDALAAEVRVGAEYAIYLEMGTYRMRAQPFLGPAAAEVTPMLDGLLRKNLQAEGLL